MTARKNILGDLNAMMTKVSAAKTAALNKQASPGDGVPDHTMKPETGEQMAKNKEEAGKFTAAKVDGGAETNKVDASVKNSTEGATAVATDGSKGTSGAELSVKNQAANGASSIQGDDKKTAGLKLAEELRKAAAGYDQPKTNESKNGIDAAKPDATKAIDAGKDKVISGKVASASPLHAFLATCKIAADMTAPAAPAAGGPAGQPSGDDIVAGLIQAIQSGSLKEEDAEKMLNEALKSGAITAADMAKAMDELHASGAPGDPAAAHGGGPGASPAAPAAPDMAPPAPVADAGAPAADPMAAKMAAAEIGPEHPEYVKKLASLYRDEAEAGYQFALKVAESMLADDKGAPPTDNGALPPKADEPGDKHDPMSDPHKALNPSAPDEMEALKHVLDEMGISPDELAAMLKQHKDMGSMGDAGCEPKMAALRKTAREAIISVATDLATAASKAAKTAAKK